MKIFCDLKVAGIDSLKEYNDLIGAVELDELQFCLPKDKEDDYYYIHLDFKNTKYHYDENKNEIIVTFSDLAETFSEENAEGGINNNDITIEMLSNAFLNMYIIFLMDKNDEFITDVKITKIYYVDESGNEVLFKVDEEHCDNHAGAYYV